MPDETCREGEPAIFRATEKRVQRLRTRILLADDHTAVRSGLRVMLDTEPDLEVVAEARDGAEAVERALADEVDVAILDITMPRMTGLQAASELARRMPELRIVILSMHDSEQYLFEALRVGACGYVLKSRADRDLVHACRAAMRGEPFLYRGTVPTLIHDHLEPGDAADARRPDLLTSRPRDRDTSNDQQPTPPQDLRPAPRRGL